MQHLYLVPVAPVAPVAATVTGATTTGATGAAGFTGVGTIFANTSAVAAFTSAFAFASTDDIAERKSFGTPVTKSLILVLSRVPTTTPTQPAIRGFAK